MITRDGHLNRAGRYLSGSNECAEAHGRGEGEALGLGQGLDLLETRGWADRASGVIEA